MNLAFSEDDEAIREEFRRVLASSSARSGLQRIEQHDEPCDQPLWSTLVETGWLAAPVPEYFGGSGLAPSSLCVLAEEIGRHAAAVPFTSSVCGVAAGLGLAPPGADRDAWLTRLADGSAIGIVLSAGDWASPPRLEDGATATLSGETHFIGDGAAASVALACIGDADPCVVLLTLPAGERAAELHGTLDLLHPPARFRFDQAAVSVLARGDEARALWRQISNRHALCCAFEQLGGAQAALDMAREYSLTRYAFGRAIGSFQAIKHMMADMLAAIELARSNCYYGAAALGAPVERFEEAVAVARISATDAYRLCAKHCLQIHGGIGVTWEADAHLHYRRAQALANAPGSPVYWKERLVELLCARQPAAA